jgi:hypothetical protein
MKLHEKAARAGRPFVFIARLLFVKKFFLGYKTVLVSITQHTLTTKSGVEMKSCIFPVLVCIMMVGCTTKSERVIPSKDPHVVGDDPIEVGRYLTIVSGCNDCHTDGYLMTEGNVPEEDWLAGSPVGWQGPWGTTYPSNLRLRVQEWTEEKWIETLKTRKGLPPMPWMNVNKMSENDMSAIYVYIKSLGPKGERMPLAVGPGEIPQTPYLSLFPQNLPTAIEQP